MLILFKRYPRLNRYYSMSIYHGCNYTYEDARREINGRAVGPYVLLVLITTIHTEGRVYHCNREQGILIYY